MEDTVEDWTRLWKRFCWEKVRPGDLSENGRLHSAEVFCATVRDAFDVFRSRHSIMHPPHIVSGSAPPPTGAGPTNPERRPSPAPAATPSGATCDRQNALPNGVATPPTGVGLFAAGPLHAAASGHANLPPKTGQHELFTVDASATTASAEAERTRPENTHDTHTSLGRVASNTTYPSRRPTNTQIYPSLTLLPQSLPECLSEQFTGWDLNRTTNAYAPDVLGHGAYALVVRLRSRENSGADKACKIVAEEPLAVRGLLDQFELEREVALVLGEEESSAEDDGRYYCIFGSR